VFTGGADKSLARPGRETSSEAYQGRDRFQQLGDARCHQFFHALEGKAPKEIHAILTQTLACFLPGRAKDLSAPLYNDVQLVTSALKSSPVDCSILERFQT